MCLRQAILQSLVFGLRTRFELRTSFYKYINLELHKMSEAESSANQEKAPEDPNTINLRVVSQDGNEVYFKIKKQTALRKLMDAYCQRQGIDPNSIRFLYDGERIQVEQTPKELEMEDNDIIDAVLQQTGGY